MLPIPVLQKSIEDFRKICGMDSFIYSAENELLAATAGTECDPCAAVNVIWEDALCYRIRTCGAGEATGTYAALLKNHLESLLAASYEHMDRETFLLRLMSRSLSPEEIVKYAKKYGIRHNVRHTVFFIQSEKMPAAELADIIEMITGEKRGHTLLVRDGQTLVWLREAKDHEDMEDMEKTAWELGDSVNAEGMVPVRIAFSRMADKPEDLPAAYREAEDAYEIGRIFYPERTVISPLRLGLGRLIFALPEEVCRAYLSELFPQGIPAALDEETLSVINAFFENDMNLSGASRQLYMHRTTLLYKLEKMAAATGIDVRLFEDAVKLQLALLIAGFLDLKDAQTKDA